MSDWSGSEAIALSLTFRSFFGSQPLPGETLATDGKVLLAATSKMAQTILDSGNNDLGALKGNHSGWLEAAKTHCQLQQKVQQLHKGHGRSAKRTISSTQLLDNIPAFPSLQTLIRLASERQVHRAASIKGSTKTRYYVASFPQTAQPLPHRLRGYWVVENKVHSVRAVTQGKDASRLLT